MIRKILFTSAIALTLLGCNSSNEEGDSGDQIWIIFEKTVEAPAIFRLTVDREGRLLSSVATLPRVEVPGLPGEYLSTGPRFVGALADHEMETLRTLVAAEQQQVYQQDACPPETGCASGTTYRLVVQPAFDSPMMAGNFAEDSGTPATRAMIDGFFSIMKRTFEEGVLATEADEARANEREWPTP